MGTLRLLDIHFFVVSRHQQTPLLTNVPLYSNTVIGTLAVDGWAVTFGTARRAGPGRAGAPPSPLLAVPNVTAHPSTASVPTLCHSMWHS